jgi:hypothetical protein
VTEGNDGAVEARKGGTTASSLARMHAYLVLFSDPRDQPGGGFFGGKKTPREAAGVQVSLC